MYIHIYTYICIFIYIYTSVHRCICVYENQTTYKRDLQKRPTKETNTGDLYIHIYICREADVVLYPSRFEGLGLSLLEALHAGTYCNTLQQHTATTHCSNALQ